VYLDSQMVQGHPSQPGISSVIPSMFDLDFTSSIISGWYTFCLLLNLHILTPSFHHLELHSIMWYHHRDREVTQLQSWLPVCEQNNWCTVVYHSHTLKEVTYLVADHPVYLTYAVYFVKWRASKELCALYNHLLVMYLMILKCVMSSGCWCYLTNP
jgi:hypothetical protein